MPSGPPAVAPIIGTANTLTCVMAASLRRRHGQLQHVCLVHEVFEDNIADTKTLLGMLDRLDLGHEGLKPVVILDAGFSPQPRPS